jgi:alcohol oxidase
MTVPDEVDIIVLGGGSCGCVVAGRLANLDHNLQVMVRYPMHEEASEDVD